MSSQGPKSAKPSKPPSQSSSATPPSRSSSSSLSSHLAMVELKQRILTSLAKLSDRDTHQIAIEDLEKIIQTLSNEGVPMLLNCLYDAANDPKPAVKKEALRLLAVLSTAHGDSTATHLTKIIAHIVKRLKDPDSGVRDACRDAIGALSSQYLSGGEVDNVGIGSVVALFVKPLFEAMSENNKVVQAGAATCMAKMVECASDPPVSAFQKLCPRICKYLHNPNFFANAALLPVIATLSQAGAIAPQSLEALLQSAHDCLGSTDWATRKAAADTLSALALHSSNLIADKAAPTLAVLESCRFDKVKPVRDSMTKALQLWKKIVGEGEAAWDDEKTSSQHGEQAEPAELSEKDSSKVIGRKNEEPAKNSSSGSSPTDSLSRVSGSNISDKAVLLKKKVPALTDKELNPEFFQKLEIRGSGDLPVEVVVPRRCINSSNTNNEEESELHEIDSRGRMKENRHSDDASVNFKLRNTERGIASTYSRQRDLDDKNDFNQRESASLRVGLPKSDCQSESFMNNKGNWLAIQRQLLQLERQQTHLMNMLQDFMGGSHDSMITLENRVRGLERVVEDMARDLSISSGRKGNSFISFEGSSNRHIGKYNGFPDYQSARFSKGSDSRVVFGERFAPSDEIGMGMRSRGPSWRSEGADAWEFQSYGKHGQLGSRRALGGGPTDGRSPRSENQSDQAGGRRAWDKGVGPVRFGEGPSARSVWQASKDEATLEAIRVAGEDNANTQIARVAIPEMTADALGDDGIAQERDTIWAFWSNAMDALQMGDMDSAFAEVLSTGDDTLLVKVMDRTGPVIDQLSSEVASEVLHAVAQFLLEPNLADICLSWIQQLVDLSVENGPDILPIPMGVKRELVLNLHEASSTVDPPEDWEGLPLDQLLVQLASAWEINLQRLDK